MVPTSGSFDEFVTGFRASLAEEASGDDILERMDAERTLRMALEEFTNEHTELSIRVIAENRLDERLAADFLVQVDDYEIRLELKLERPAGTPTLTLEQLTDLAALLEDNPSTVALVVTWVGPELLSAALTLHRIHYLRRSQQRLSDLIKQRAPIGRVLNDILAHQVKSWKADFTLDEQPLQTPASVRTVFRQDLEKAIESERKRTYRFEERKEAAHRFPVEKETAVVMAVLDSALEGASADELAERLTRPIRRGGA